MIQSDSFGQFNADISKFDGIQRDMIVYATTKLRDDLVYATTRLNHQRHDFSEYLDYIADDYVRLAHFIHSFYHW